jgi:hypothetical protein
MNQKYNKQLLLTTALPRLRSRVGRYVVRIAPLGIDYRSGFI